MVASYSKHYMERRKQDTMEKIDLTKELEKSSFKHFDQTSASSANTLGLKQEPKKKRKKSKVIKKHLISKIMTNQAQSHAVLPKDYKEQKENADPFASDQKSVTTCMTSTYLKGKRHSPSTGKKIKIKKVIGSASATRPTSVKKCKIKTIPGLTLGSERKSITRPTLQTVTQD